MIMMNSKLDTNLMAEKKQNSLIGWKNKISKGTFLEINWNDSNPDMAPL